MAIKNELSILTKAEQTDLYSPPLLAIEEQRLYFTLNDHELTECKSIRQRPHRCYFIALLGYFKTKPNIYLIILIMQVNIGLVKLIPINTQQRIYRVINSVFVWGCEVQFRQNGTF
jgi:hypothetical protein